jgi:outer membrane immunogenic protein
MRVHLRNLLISALSLGPAQIAFAADLPVKAPVYRAPPVYSWSGCYIGAQVGYGWLRDNNTETFGGAVTAVSPTNTADPSGLKVGGMLGCNWQWSGPFVVGLEGDGEWADINGGSVTYPGSGAGGPDDFYEAQIRWQASARGRVGYAFDRTLFYATGGAAFARIRHIYTVAVVGPAEEISTTRTGWTVGGGVEHAFAPNWTARVEYRYADFGTITNVSTVFGATQDHDLTEHAVRFGLAYKFNGGL